MRSKYFIAKLFHMRQHISLAARRISLKKKKQVFRLAFLFLEVPPGFEPGIKVLQTYALPLGYGTVLLNYAAHFKNMPENKNGADDEARTRYLHLGKVALYQMSYIRTCWCLRPESNQRHVDFQSTALPTELQRHKFGL